MNSEPSQVHPCDWLLTSGGYSHEDNSAFRPAHTVHGGWLVKKNTTQSHNFGLVKVMLRSKGLGRSARLSPVEQHQQICRRWTIAAMSRASILFQQHLLWGFSAESKHCSSWYLQEPGSRAEWPVSAFNVQSIKTPLLPLLLLVCHCKLRNSAPIRPTWY